MLSENDYNHIKLLYDQFYKMNRYINKLMSDGEWETVQNAISDKEVLLHKIVSFEKANSSDIKANPELHAYRLRLKQLEQENIDLVTNLRKDTLQDLHLVKQAKKIVNAYEPSLNNSVSTFEVTNE